MKRIIISLALFTLLLTACGNTQAVSTQTSYDLPVATLLVLGTLKLENTDQAVSSEQAKELLPMWQVYLSLNNNSTAAQAEIDGLVEQIQETMSTEQMNAISEMNLTQQDMFASMQDQGGNMGQARQSSGSSSSQSGGSFTPLDGGMAGGPPPDGGMAGSAPSDGGMGGDMGGFTQGTSTSQSQATVAGSGAGRSAGIPSALVETLIEILEQRAGS